MRTVALHNKTNMKLSSTLRGSIQKCLGSSKVLDALLVHAYAHAF